MMSTSLNRFQAFAIHLAFSLVILAVIILLITQVWYPDILFALAGGFGAVVLVSGIDLILGPVLTLIVYDVKKKSLKFDLAVILVIQLCALGGGVYSITYDRPIAVIYDGIGFTPVFAAYGFADEVVETTNRLESYVLYAPALNLVAPEAGLADAQTFEDAVAIKVVEQIVSLQAEPEKEKPYILAAIESTNKRLKLDRKTGAVLGVVE